MAISFKSAMMKKKIHPAIDLVGDKLYLGLILPIEGKEKVFEDLCFVNDDKETFIASVEELKARNLGLQFPAVGMELKWSLESIENFVNDTVKNNPSSIFTQIKELLATFIEFPDPREYTFISLWIIGTYLQPIWYSYPYIGISGIKQSGKSKALKFIEMLGFNPLFSVNISTASLYRLIQSLRCTFLLDESEILSGSDRKMEIKNILYSGYKKYGYVFRTVKTEKDRIVPEKFEVFSPKVFVTFLGLEDILMDRSINVVMLRTKNPKIENTDIREGDPIWQELRDKLYTFLMKNWRNIRELYYQLPDIEGVVARARELWRPILVLAKYFGDDVFKEISELARDKIKEQLEEDVQETRQMILLRALVRLVKEDRFYPVSEVKKTIAEMLEEDEGVQWLTTSWVGRTLSKSFRISERRRAGRGTERRMTPEMVQKLAKRYNIPFETEPEHPSQEGLPSSQVKRYIQEISETESRLSAIIDAVKVNLGIQDEEKIRKFINESLSPEKLLKLGA